MRQTVSEVLLLFHNHVLSLKHLAVNSRYKSEETYEQYLLITKRALSRGRYVASFGYVTHAITPAAPVAALLRAFYEARIFGGGSGHFFFANDVRSIYILSGVEIGRV